MWIIESPFFIWRNEIPLFYLKNWKSLFLFEEIEFPFFIWRNWKSLFLFAEIESSFFIWIPLFYLNWKSLFFFEEIEYPFFIWRNWKSLFYLKKWNPFILFECYLRIFDVKTNWILGQKIQNSARYIGAFWWKFCFLEENTIKCLVL